MTRFREAVFDLMSYARRGPGRRDHLSPAQIQQIARTVHRTPEVMVKVLPRGTNSLASVQKHLSYIGRNGDVPLETDEGEALPSRQGSKVLLANWDLDLEEHRGKRDLLATRSRPAPKLVHKVMFSMPPGTPANKVLTAVRTFCREEFALKHRYALALHTDEPHPHVHVVIKAMSEQGERLHIRKATLRHWRCEFARHLRDLGVSANATDRFLRGETRPRKPDSIYRATLRGESTHLRDRVLRVAQELAQGRLQVEPGKRGLMSTRSEVRSAWRAVTNLLNGAGSVELAALTRRYMDQMPPPRTEKEYWAAKLQERQREPPTKATGSSR
jgi:type IV secretory pathway VirD2 relaxase